MIGSGMSMWPYWRQWDSAGMADSYYILFAEWNYLSEDGNEDQEMEGVKQGPSDHIRPYIQPSEVKSQIFQVPKMMNLPVIEANLGQVSVTYNAIHRYGQYWQFRFYLSLLGARTTKCKYFFSPLRLPWLPPFIVLSSSCRSTPGLFNGHLQTALSQAVSEFAGNELCLSITKWSFMWPDTQSYSSLILVCLLWSPFQVAI